MSLGPAPAAASARYPDVDEDLPSLAEHVAGETIWPEPSSGS
jgi:hypothetical protein